MSIMVSIAYIDGQVVLFRVRLAILMLEVNQNAGAAYFCETCGTISSPPPKQIVYEVVIV